MADGNIYRLLKPQNAAFSTGNTTSVRAAKGVITVCSFYCGAIQSILTNWWKLPRLQIRNHAVFSKDSSPTNTRSGQHYSGLHPSLTQLPSGTRWNTTLCLLHPTNNQLHFQANSLPHKHKATTPHCIAPVISIYPVLHLFFISTVKDILQ